MDLQKTFLYAAVFVLAFMLWTQWVKESTEQATPSKVTATERVSEAGVPDVSPGEQAPHATTSTTPSVPTTIAATPVSRLVTVKTDVMEVLIDSKGGNVVQVGLIDYPQTREDKNIPFLLLNDNPDSRYVAQSGLVSKMGPDRKQRPAQYRTSQKNYRLTSSQDQLHVDLRWRNQRGVNVTKRFTFKRGSYAIKMDYIIQNKGAQTWSGYTYQQLSQRYTQHKKRSLLNISGYQGGAISSPDKAYKKISFKSLQRKNVSENIKGGWAAMQQHYFLSAWVPSQTAMQKYYSRYYSNSETYALGMVGPKLNVKPGEQITTGATLYAGPELMDQLKGIAPNLELTIDFGWLWFISLAIFWVMTKIYFVVGNWGWAIILVTMSIKLAFYKLSAKSYKSMAALRRLSPRIKTLKERFGDDRQGFSRAMMELYKKEKVNPFGGCLPIVVQIPVFIALYYVLLESVQLRHAPFMFWLQDLSVRDPYFILPVLVGALLLIQQKLSPPPPDPMQAKVMMLMPIMFTGLFLYLPAGLALYMFVNNGLSILQQWYIMRKFADKKPVTSKA